MHKLANAASTRTNTSQNRARRQQQQQQQPHQQPHQQQHQHQRTDASDAAHEHRASAQQAHTRTPVLIREPSVLESLSRGLRTYLPASISPPPAPRRRPLSPDSDAERIGFAAWEPGRVLVLGYATGVQLWDAGDLAAVREVLNLGVAALGTAGPVVGAALLPPPPAADEFAGARPLLGVLTPAHLTVYSLAQHAVVKQVPFADACALAARPAFTVVSTAHPATLHVLSPALTPLHTLALAAPAPLFALSHRLLAYVAPPPAHPPAPAQTFVARARDSLGASVLRLSGDVWNAVTAGADERERDRDRDRDLEHDRDRERERDRDHERTWGFSRSAPASSGVRARWSTHSEHADDHDHTHDAHSPDPSTSTGAGTAWVTVLDLASLRAVARFMPFTNGGVAHLAWAGAGAGGTPLLCVAPRDGQRVAVFQVRPGGAGENRGAGRESERDGDRERERERGGEGEDGGALGMPWHWYDLHRGVTSARVESVVWERAGRWVGVATGRRTVHVFPTNPYGGKPDGRTHLGARVYNAAELQPLSTDLTPLVRLRPPAPPADTAPADAAPLAFTFLPAAATRALPPALAAASSHYSTSSAHVSAPRSPPLSPPVQDVLLFDPATGTLALRRIVLDAVAAPSTDAAAAGGDGMGMGMGINIPGAAGYSLSVPGAAGYSMSLPVPVGVRRRREAGEFMGRESVLATWALKRGREWAEVRGVLGGAGGVPAQGGGRAGVGGKVSPGDYLSHAELSTHSRSASVLPRAIYLSHQFAFHAFGEDFHALLRRSQLDLPCTKIAVRKPVEVRAYAESDAFLQDEAPLSLSLSRDRRARGSFDEPIASAMRSALDYSGQSPPVLPMLPNGAAQGVLDALPLHTKHVVGEGLGRIRREIGKVRSPVLRPSAARRVPLEFDEEDEAAFIEGEGEGEGEGTTRDDGSGSGASASVSTPSSRSRADLDLAAGGEDDDALWDAWDDEVQAAVAEAETFDEISATGFMDEEQAPIMAAMTRQQGKGKRR